MVESEVLDAQERKPHGSADARRLRRKGFIPAVLYGHKEATVPLTISRDDLARVMRHGSRVVDLQAGGKTEKALIKEVQWDHLGHDVLHVDFNRVSADERITVEVRIEMRGIAPGVTAGGLLNQPLHTLEVECLAISVPESIRVNIGELQIGGAIHVRELTLPEGVKALADPEAIVVQVAAPAAEAAEPAVPGEATSAEPEIIGRVKGEEEGEE